RLTPFGPHGHGAAAGALDDVKHAFAKDSVNADHDVVAGLDHVYKGRFHARAPGCGDRNRHSILSLEHVTQHFLNLVHATQELWIKVAEQWLSHCWQHANFNRARPRTQEDSPGRLKAFVRSRPLCRCWDVWHALLLDSLPVTNILLLQQR